MANNVSAKFNLDYDFPDKPEYYNAAVAAMRRFVSGNEIPADRITPDFINRFILSLIKGGATVSTAASYFRAIRSIYNKEVKAGNLIRTDAFKTPPYILGIQGNCLSNRDLKFLAEYDFGKMQAMSKCRDIFMFSFYAQGLSFERMATLRKDDVNGGFLTVGDDKILWLSQMSEISGKYANSHESLMFPFLADWSRERYADTLADISSFLGLRCKLTPLTAETTYRIVCIRNITDNAQNRINAIFGAEPHWRAIRNHHFDSRNDIRISVERVIGENNGNTDIFIPELKVARRNINGKKELVDDPAVKNLVFVKCTQSQAAEIQAVLGRGATVIFYFEGLRKIYSRISDCDMNSFIIAINGGLDGFETTDIYPEFVRNQRVMIVGHPILDGLVGYVDADCTETYPYVNVCIEGIGLVIRTQHIHRSLLKPL